MVDGQPTTASISWPWGGTPCRWSAEVDFAAASTPHPPRACPTWPARVRAGVRPLEPLFWVGDPMTDLGSGFCGRVATSGSIADVVPALALLSVALRDAFDFERSLRALGILDLDFRVHNAGVTLRFAPGRGTYDTQSYVTREAARVVRRRQPESKARLLDHLHGELGTGLPGFYERVDFTSGTREVFYVRRDGRAFCVQGPTLTTECPVFETALEPDARRITTNHAISLGVQVPGLLIFKDEGFSW